MPSPDARTTSSTLACDVYSISAVVCGRSFQRRIQYCGEEAVAGCVSLDLSLVLIFVIFNLLKYQP